MTCALSSVALRSLKNDWLYIGLTNDVARRLREHNRGYSKSTKGKGPFELIHTEAFGSRREARSRERQLKSGSGRECLKHAVAQARPTRAGPACRQAGSKSRGLHGP